MTNEYEIYRPFFPVSFRRSLYGASDTERSVISADGNVRPRPVVQIASWTAPKVQHAYGLPESKPKAKGTLTIDSTGFTFSSKASQYAIPWSSAIALSNGTERVELWGTTGRIVRMMIPDGGGLAAAGVMHHKVNELTIEFHDSRGAYHGAVFLLPGSDATRVLDSYTQATSQAKENSLAASLPEPPVCDGNVDATHGVVVAAPSWSQIDVPAAYRALVYEHIIDRMQRIEGVGHVYRAGEGGSQQTCARYTVTISVVSFKPGSQVQRATMGPIGFFAGTTQMAFSANITDTSGKLNVTNQIKATVRGESESKNVADGVAKKLAKYYSSSTKPYEHGQVMGKPEGFSTALLSH